ncbi:MULTISPECIES: NAD-dependent succinate-semialdehyde dehydrogenase [Rhizobium/Agrobacterium group]|uniref:NAD-dependent succinate-semialdehyde dehydrogenase n=1 Tax=Agrobacterium cucumeris TaxID=2862866 RepID=A0ABY8RVV6_9HYPH|nr:MULTISPECIES: NAD-dependent succinate-semialdehyde dehydrogenase [Rhizobium/Agrobacterium group]MCZ7472696.1 NAD-dependent succinate-semialdehyde dehydrogenase [Rhizobium rhizogenes]MCZ7484147.1 NAD-dependent succinate-semialdehyde dehydrogenase [Rhizobium rhizogenes]WHO11641.1 NAD-dependent succinate-semialdehyde dehydrogenase [Agrobacterium cucumeris]
MSNTVINISALDPRLLINGEWFGTEGRQSTVMINPATGEEIARLPHATPADLDAALNAAQRAYRPWRDTHPKERGRILKKAADLLRARVEEIAPIMTIEMGKPLAEARIEVAAAADELEWYAEEGRRVYGRVIPGRVGNTRFQVVREPVGPSAAFAAWNFPIVNAVRKVGASLAAGCPCIYKPGEEVASSSLSVARALLDAGLPPGLIAFVFGVPSDISSYLIASPVIRKISFTGSVSVGKHLTKLAAESLKRTTMELGGHAPVLVFKDAPLEQTLDLSVQRKFRNAGQVCVSPTRFYVEDSVYDDFCAGFAQRAKAIKVGNGLQDGVQMGPLVHRRRLEVVERFVQDAVAHGGRILAGGERIGNEGNFWAPTVIADVPETAMAMNEEPFGPIALINRFSTAEEALEKANRLPFGLAAYAFTTSSSAAMRVADELQAGMVAINSFNVATPEAPFGGIKESGNGSELGTEGLDAYFETKMISLT